MSLINLSQQDLNRVKGDPTAKVHGFACIFGFENFAGLEFEKARLQRERGFFTARRVEGRDEIVVLCNLDVEGPQFGVAVYLSKPQFAALVAVSSPNRHGPELLSVHQPRRIPPVLRQFDTGEELEIRPDEGPKTARGHSRLLPPPPLAHSSRQIDRSSTPGPDVSPNPPGLALEDGPAHSTTFAMQERCADRQGFVNRVVPLNHAEPVAGVEIILSTQKGALAHGGAELVSKRGLWTGEDFVAGVPNSQAKIQII